MVKLVIIPLKKSIDKAYLKVKPVREDFDNFKINLKQLLSDINDKESEEHNKNLIRDFLKNSFYSGKYINTKEKTDLAIHLEKSGDSKAGVLIEAKRPSNKADMITVNNLNCKAMHEVILYYLRERIDLKNDEVKNIIITNANDWFIFKADQFEKCFFKTSLKKEYGKWRDDKKVSAQTEHFYNEIAAGFLSENDFTIEAVHFNLKEFEKYLTRNEENLIPLYKILSPAILLKEPFANDSNTLNKQFYLELLHIIGLEEQKKDGKKQISRKENGKRDEGSLIENTIRILKTDDALRNLDNKEKYGATEDEQLFNAALELNITWINRVLFLKLLEAQLITYHRGDEQYKFLNHKVIHEYDDLYELFHEVLAKKVSERNNGLIKNFQVIPYLNSSLFDISELERNTIKIYSLKDRFTIPLFKQTVFKDVEKSHTEMPALEYLLKFLDAFDFASEGGTPIKKEKKTIINASVLGLIFEKINGYKEGSYYTPGFITMYMARETLRRAVVQKFNDALKTDYKDFDDLKKNIDTTSAGREQANKIINDLKICDPAVGSGHFLVSCLNEIIAIKAELRVLNDREGRPVQNYSFEIDNDELIIVNEDYDEPFEYHLNPNNKPISIKQELQETLFHEKETIIENCLFGVDINPNSVNICRLRLWIELLKNAYYTKASGYTELETLPNIDINIKQGNSLISRFDIKDDYSKLTNAVIQKVRFLTEKYKEQVFIYKSTSDKKVRNNTEKKIKEIKEQFEQIANPNDKDYRKIKELENKLAEEVLLFSRDEIDEWNKKREKLQDELRNLKTSYEEKQKTIYGNAFEWRFEFPEVLDEDGKFVGFDVVIGNPPYIREEFITKYKFYFKMNYLAFNGNADIYVYFYELGIRISNINGLINFITSNKWIQSNYGTNLRNIVKDCSVVFLIDFGELKVFEDVGTFPSIILLQNNNVKMNFKYIEISSLDTFINSEDILFYEHSSNELNNERWTFHDNTSARIIKRLENSFKSLGELFNNKFYSGVKTGLNSKLIFSNEQANTIIKDFDNERILFKKIIFGKDIIKYQTKFENLSLVFFPYFYIDNKNVLANLEEFKNTFNYLTEFKLELAQRAIIKDGIEKKTHTWYELQQINRYLDYCKPKIIYPDIALENRFIYDEHGIIPDMTCFVIPTEKKEYLAILNSKVFKFLASHYCPVLGNINEGGRIRYKSTYLSKIPIPSLDNKDINLLKRKVEKMILLTSQKLTTEIDVLDNEINKIVYQLYGLTEEEIKIVEGEIK